jgi:ActR/RegA family two-component response regulator
MPGSARASYVGPRARFLVVEDDPLVGRSLARMVRPFGEPVVVGDVAGANAALGEPRPWQGLFIDLQLPDGSGLDVIERARLACPAARAMVLTGHVEPALINAVHDLGATYVVKPIDRDRIERFCGGLTGLRRARRKEATDARPSSAEEGTVAASAEDHLDQRITRLRQLLSVRPTPRVRYAVGAIVAEIKANPDLYGRGAMVAVATALGEDLPSLYRHAAVAECWTETEVAALLDRKGPGGRTLSWSHIVLLGSLSSAHARARLVEQALRESLSVRDLAVRARESADEA